MTVKELSKLYWLNREIELNLRQLAALEADIQADKEQLAMIRASMDGLKSPVMDENYPYGTQHTGTHSPTEDTVLKMAQIEDNIKRKHETELNIRALISTRQTLCLLERDRLERYIDGIGDEYLRQVFTLRFINGLPWDQVAASIGGNNQADTVKKMCYRYIKKNA